MQSLICSDIISASDEASSANGLFLKKYTFNPNAHYQFAGHSYQALAIKEPDLELIVKYIKEIQVSNDTTDKLLQLFGPVHEQTTKNNLKEWKYNFIFNRELNADQKNEFVKLNKEYERLSSLQVNAKAELVSEREREHYYGTGDISKIKYNSNMISSIQEQMTAINEKTMAIELTEKQTLVQIVFLLDTTGKINHINLNKISDDGSNTCIYTKGDDASVVVSSGGNQKTQDPKDAAMPIPPPKPYPGMIYLNTSEKHFYGWDGTSWLKMDVKP
jgi:hypothetical protein